MRGKREGLEEQSGSVQRLKSRNDKVVQLLNFEVRILSGILNPRVFDSAWLSSRTSTQHRVSSWLAKSYRFFFWKSGLSFVLIIKYEKMMLFVNNYTNY